MSIAKGTYREYETIYVMRPDAGDDATRAIRDRLKAIFDKLGGHVSHWDDWGKRKLAFEIRDRSAMKQHNKGYYVYLRYGGKNDLVAEIERNLRMQESVLRYLLVRLDADFDIEAARTRGTQEPVVSPMRSYASILDKAEEEEDGFGGDEDYKD